MCALRVEVLSSLEEVAPEAWNAIVGPDGLIRTHGYLLAIERSRVNECRHRYFVCRGEHGEILAHAGYYLIANRLDLFVPKGSRLARVLAFVRKFAPDVLTLRTLECGTPTALGHTISFSTRLSQSDRSRILGLLVDAMDSDCRVLDAAAIVIRDFRDDELAAFSSFVGAGFQLVPNLDNTTFAVRWASFEEYLRALSGRYRRTIRHEMKLAAEAGVRCEHVVDFSAHAEDMARLWTLTAQNAREYQREVLDADYFRNLNGCEPGRTSATLFRIGDTLVAFVMYLEDETVLTPVYIGVDYTYNRKAALVFNTYYDMIRRGIETGKRTIKLGNTAYDTKLRIGARLEPLRMYVRHRSHRLTRPIAALFRWMAPQQGRVSWNVFKSDDSGAAAASIGPPSRPKRTLPQEVSLIAGSSAADARCTHSSAG